MNIKFELILVFIIAILLISCNSTKYLTDNEYLLTKNKVKINENKNESKLESKGYDNYDIEELIRPKLNSKLFGFIRVYLAFYNFYSPEKTKHKVNKKIEKCKKKKQKKYKKFTKKIIKYEKKRDYFVEGSKKHTKYTQKLYALQERKNISEQELCDSIIWTQRMGEAPVLYRTNDEYRNKRQIRIFLKNKGYHDAKIGIIVYEKKNKKKNVMYEVSPGRPYLINLINYNISDSVLKSIVFKDSINSLIKKNMRFDIEALQNERQRISNYLRNSGYYKFTKEYIFYTADTLNRNYSVNITLNIKQTKDEADNYVNHKKYYIDNVFIYPAFEPKKALNRKEQYFFEFDTTAYLSNNSGFYFLNREEQKIKSKTLIRGAYIFPDSLYKLDNTKSTYKYLSSLKIIKIANINFFEIEKTDTTKNNDNGFIDCDIRLTQNKLQSFTFEFELTNTSGNIGSAGNIIYSHKNIFHNAEVLRMSLKGAMERQLNIINADIESGMASNFFNSYEYGTDISIEFPRFLAPIRIKSFLNRFNPKTLVSTNFSFRKRPDYTRTILGLSFGYFWNSSNNVKHIYRPVALDLVDLKNPTKDFLEYINKLHLYESYQDHLIVASSYSIIINNQSKKNQKNFTFLKINGKLAGNSLSGIMKLSGKEKPDTGYTFLENIYAQFAKADIDLRYYRKLIRENDKLIFRTFVGIAYPYGNLDVIPFGEQYFSGGANSVRAWQVRSLGPGTYSLPGNLDVFPNQTADIKIEGNFEYRMKFFWILEGAFFIDAGNIWTINDEDEREGAGFDFDDFYKEIAIGTGIGFRFDFDFFIIRFDFGLKMKDPAFDEDRRWVIGNRNFRQNDWTFNIGIGYPF